jgi:hypothetical protein
MSYRRSVFVWSSAPKRRLRDENARIAACRSAMPKSGQQHVADEQLGVADLPEQVVADAQSRRPCG